MPKISDYNLYDIDALNQAWKDVGWKALAELGAKLGVSCHPHSVGWEIMSAFDEVYIDMGSEQCSGFNQVAWKPEDLVTLAAIPKGVLYTYRSEKEYHFNPYTYRGSTREDNKLRRLLQVVLTAFVNSKSLEDALSKINEKNWRRFAKHSFDRETEGWIKELLSVKIGGRWVEAIKWLVYGLRNTEACQEANWNCIWLYTKPMRTKLMEIKRSIDSNTPLPDEQLLYLNAFMEGAYPRGLYVIRCDDTQTYEICLQPQIAHRPLYKSQELLGIEGPSFRSQELRGLAIMLLVQPAFNLAQQLHSQCSKPRFVRQCRAPSCGKRFYTGRKNAVVCPSTTSVRASECRLEWIRYMRWLKNLNKNPESDWNHPMLKENFLRMNS